MRKVLLTRHGAAVFYYVGPDVLPDVQPGDFLLHHSSAMHSRLIRFGERLRFHGSDRTYAFWNHASFCTAPGELVEALGRGIVKSPLEKYAGSIFAVVRVPWTAQDRQEAVWFALSGIGERYGWLTLVGIGLHMLTGGKLVIGLDGSEICSARVARALERGTTIFEHHDPEQVTPADLARHFNVPAPPKL